MKKFIYKIAAVCVVLGSGCHEKFELYSDSDAKLNFLSDTLVQYSFRKLPSAQKRDTIWLEMQTIGFLSNSPRRVKIVQEPTWGTNAVAGVHFVAFDDASLQDKYLLGAGKTRIEIPIIVLRDDPQLDTEKFRLKLRIAENEDFKAGYAEDQWVVITLTNQLVKPSRWNSYYGVNYCYKTYGPVKHQFMIDVTGESIDNDWIYALGVTNGTYSMSYLTYLGTWFQRKLNELNAERALSKLSPLAEEDGTLVEFVYY